MIVRLVKMTFREDEVKNFQQLFDRQKEKIGAFPGCKYLSLLHGKDDPRIFFTYSIWESTDDLETYRHSDLFKETWAQTKVLFDAKPEAWSTEMEYSVLPLFDV